MEEKQIQLRSQPVPQSRIGQGPAPVILKTRTMQDDLKKAASQPPIPIALPKSLASFGPQAPLAGRIVPEPPARLPGVVIGPQPPKAIVPPLSPAGQTALSRPPALMPKPAAAVRPAAGESFRQPAVLKFSQSPNPSIRTALSSLQKRLIIAGVAVLLVGAGTYFFWLARTQEPEPTKSCQGEISPNCPPVSMVGDMEQLSVDAKNRDLNQIVSDIKSGAPGDLKPKARLVALKTSFSPDAYATFDDFLNIFGLNISTRIKENTANFNLLVQTNPAEQSDALSPQTKKEVRLVLILKQKDPGIANEAMRTWETEMVGDLSPLLLAAPSNPPLSEFSTRVYNNGTFRYFSMPNYHLTINYVVTGDYLIIGTSRESIFYIYDLISAAK